jgi:hypothetical protein
LEIETGRWYNIPKDERFCTLCGQSIGDEFHLLFVCCNEYLVNLRSIYLIFFFRYCLGFPSEFKKKQFYFFPQNILERNPGNEIPRSRKLHENGEFKKNTEHIKNIIELKCNIELEIRFKT